MGKTNRSKLSIRKETMRRLDSGQLARVRGGYLYGGGSTTCATMGSGSGGCATETIGCLTIIRDPTLEEPEKDTGF